MMVRYISICVALSAAILLNGCTTFLPTIHYRLTVVIDTPQGRRTGSGVMELTSHISPKIPGPEAGGLRFMVHGEAVPIKLSNGNYIFVVRKWQRGEDEALAMLQASFADILTPVPRNAYGDTYYAAIKKQIRELARFRGSRPVDPDYYPIVAYFPDISNPESIRAANAGRVDEVYVGARLVSMSLEITDDEVTRKILTILPWLKNYRGGYFDKKSIYLTINPGEKYPSEKLIGKSNLLSD